MLDNKFAILCASNKETVIRDNLMQSPLLISGKVRFDVINDPYSASKAYNRLIEKAGEKILIFAHQDVYFPDGWEDKLLEQIGKLPDNWGVLGVVGVDLSGSYGGRCWCNLHGENNYHSSSKKESKIHRMMDYQPEQFFLYVAYYYCPNLRLGLHPCYDLA